MLTDGTQPTLTGIARHGVGLLLILSLGALGCAGSGANGVPPGPATLRIGFGLTAGTSPEIGIQQTARNIALEGLVGVRRDGRAVPVLAESWSVSEDGLVWHLRLHRAATFHSGKPANAQSIQQILQKQLPGALGPAIDDIADIRAVSDHDLEFLMRRRSTFLLERLDLAIQEPGSDLSGTGPFLVVNSETNQVEMKANEAYYGGKPLIDRVTLMPYTSVRAAWADMLRGKVDMLYDVGVEALDSIEASKEIQTYTFQRGYAYMMLLNVRRPHLADAAFRRALNAAIDRDALVRDIFEGHGAPAEGAVWPHHWAFAANLPRLQYDPEALDARSGPHRFKCLFVDPSHERLALAIQRQLQAIGVELELEMLPGSQVLSRLQSGDFDAILADFVQGPNLVRPYLFWHSGGPFNWGHYRNSQADAALDAIRHASSDEAYKAGVSAFQQVIVDDPPAIFLVWRERARAVSARFRVPARPEDDILSSLHLWRPTTEQLAARRN
jgi:peptide/nickel transport system substrate-binding protein